MKINSILFGWQHFQFQIPNNWDLVAEYGHEQKGYLRLDDLETTRLELKWQTIPKKTKLLDLVAEHAKKIGWENNKIQKLNETGNAFSIENRADNINQQVLFLKGNHPKSRLAVFRLFYKLNENGSKLVKDIVNTFADQLFEEQSLWAYYDCKQVLPSVYKKMQANLNAGNKEIILAYRNKFIYSWTISLTSHFCPHKPFNQQTLNTWVYDLLKNKFNKEVVLKQESFLENLETNTKTSFAGRFLLRNIFHFSHNWKIFVKYNNVTDILKIVILNYAGEKDLKRFQKINELVN